MAGQTYRIPVLASDGRLPDAYTPQEVIDSSAAAAAARDATEQTVIPGLTWTGAVDLTTIVTGPVYLRSTLTGNVTLTLPTPSAARAFTVTIDLRQDTTGSRLLVIKNAGTSYAVPIALQTAANSRDIIHLLWTGADWVALLGAPAVGIPTSWIVS